MSDRLAAALVELVDAIRAEVRAELEDRPTGPDRLLDVDQAAAMLNVGRTKLYQEIQAGRVRSISVGRRRLVPASSIGEYIAARAEG